MKIRHVTHRRMGVSIRGISTECLNENQIEFRNLVAVICLQEMRHERARRISCAFYCVLQAYTRDMTKHFSSIICSDLRPIKITSYNACVKMSRHLYTNYFEEEIMEARRDVNNSSWLEGWANSLMLISPCSWWMEEQKRCDVLWWQQTKTAFVNLIWPRNEIILESTLRNTLKILYIRL
jgi:hypothetical protein